MAAWDDVVEGGVTDTADRQRRRRGQNTISPHRMLLYLFVFRTEDGNKERGVYIKSCLNNHHCLMHMYTTGQRGVVISRR